MPRRLGLTLRPALKSLILVSRGARINRPKARVAGVEQIIKNDQLNTTLNRSLDSGSPLLLAKLIGSASLEQIARSVAALHRPASFDWAARFGATPPLPDAVPPPVAAPPALPPPSVAAAPPSCFKCGAGVSKGIADYCHEHRSRFDGLIFCMGCQRGIGPKPHPSAGGDGHGHDGVKVAI